MSHKWTRGGWAEKSKIQAVLEQESLLGILERVLISV
jgi:hypothetical protein